MPSKWISFSDAVARMTPVSRDEADAGELLRDALRKGRIDSRAALTIKVFIISSGPFRREELGITLAALPINANDHVIFEKAIKQRQSKITRIFVNEDLFTIIGAGGKFEIYFEDGAPTVTKDCDLFPSFWDGAYIDFATFFAMTELFHPNHGVREKAYKIDLCIADMKRLWPKLDGPLARPVGRPPKSNSPELKEKAQEVLRNSPILTYPEFVRRLEDLFDLSEATIRRRFRSVFEDFHDIS